MTDTDRFCPACGYNLRGVESDRCPECGTAFDRSLPTESPIPWVHRKKLGKFRAFWRTVKLATLTPKYFEREIERPVSLADALAFRRLVVWHAFIPIAVLASWAYLVGFELFDHPWFANDRLACAIEWIGWPVLLGSIWLFLYFVTGVQSYAFAPRWLDVKHQNRAIAVSYYASAGWAYVLPVISFISIGIAITTQIYSDRDPPLIVLALIVLVLIVPLIAQLFAIVPQRLLLRTIRMSKGRMFAIDLAYGGAICGLAVLTICALNAAYWFCALILITAR